MGICFSRFLFFYSLFLLKFLSEKFQLFLVSRFEKQQKYPFNPLQENKGNFWYFSLWRPQTSLCFGARHLAERTFLFSVLRLCLLPALCLANSCAFGKLQLAHPHIVGRESLNFTNNVSDKEPEALAGFAPSYRCGHSGKGWKGLSPCGLREALLSTSSLEKEAGTGMEPFCIRSLKWRVGLVSSVQDERSTRLSASICTSRGAGAAGTGQANAYGWDEEGILALEGKSHHLNKMLF